MKNIKHITLVLLLLVLSSCSSEKKQVSRSEQFIVGMECNYAPNNWTQAKSSPTTVSIGGGQYCDGYDVDIAKIIAKDLNKELVVKKIEWDGLIPSVNNGDIDAIIAGMSPTAERAEVIDFSEGYSLTSFVVVTKKDGSFSDVDNINNFKDAKVSAQLGTFHVKFLDQMKGIKKVNPMKDFPTMAVALNSGEIDGFVSDNETAETIVKTNDKLKVNYFSESNGFTYDKSEVITSIGVKKGNTTLLSGINKSLKDIGDEQFVSLKKAAMARQDQKQTSSLGIILDIFLDNYHIFFYGMLTTLFISITATILGFFIGLFVAIIRGNRLGNILANIYVTVFRGTPMMVQAMIFYYALPPLLGNFSWSDIPFGPIIAGVFIVTINTGAYLAETIRSGIQAIDKGQFEAAKSLGFSKFASMRYIILPQAIKNVIPALGNEFIVNIKDTSVLNVIQVSELFLVSSAIAGSNYRKLETFYITALIYLLLTSIFTLILRKIEKNLDNKQNGFTSIPSSQTSLNQLQKVKEKK